MTSTTISKHPCQTKVVVVGTIRNVSRSLVGEVKNLTAALQGFNQVQWLLIESDSTDNTVQVLKQLAADDLHFHYQSLGNLDQSIPERTERIAYCRNSYLEKLEQDPRYLDTQFVIMADLDGINNILKRSAIDSCFIRDDWDGCFANTLGPYYDIWALRHPTWCPTDCLQEFDFLKQHGWGEYAARFAAIYSKMITIKPSAPWIQVSSAFSGLGIYKKKSIIGLRYQAFEGTTAICEHVLLHRSMGEAGCKLFINPLLLNCKNPPHTRKLRFPENLVLRLKLLFSAKP